MKTILLTILASLPLFAAPLTAVRSRAPIQLDGVLDEAAWHAAPAVTEFRDYRQHTPAKAKTEVRFAYDDDAIYIGIRAQLGPGAKKVNANDKNIYAGECVEVMLDPGATRTRYFHFLINPNGARQDEFRDQGGFVGDLSWDAIWETKSARTEDGWSCEVRIPFSSMEFPDGDSLTWAVNVTRSAYDLPPDGKGIENSAITPDGSYSIAGKFRELAGFDRPFRQYAGWSLRKPAVTVAQAKQGLAAEAALTVANSDALPRRIHLTLDFHTPDGRDVQRKSTAVEVAAGTSDTVSIKGFRFDAPGDYRCVATVRDAVTKRILLRLPCVIPLRYQMLALKLDAPHYKNAIFATMNLKEVRLRAIAALPPADLKGKSIRAEIRDAAGKALASAVRPAAPETAFAFPAQPLPDGKLTIHAELLDGGKAIAAASHPLRKLPYKQGEVWLDTDGMPVLDGKRTYIVSQWCGTDDYLPGVHAFLDWHSYQDTLVISPAFTHNRAIRALKQRESLSAANRSLIRETAIKAAAEPRLFAYYLCDEPEVFGDTVAALEQFYEVLSDVDPYHPILVSNDTIKGLYDYRNCYDLNGLHAYPRPARDRYYANFSRILANCDNFRGATTAGHSAITFLWLCQGFDYTDYAAANTRVPAYREFRTEYYLTIIAGAGGAEIYNRLNDHYPEVGIGLGAIVRELRAFSPVLAERAAPLPLQAPTAFRWTARRHNGHLWLFVVNASDQDAGEAELALPELKDATLRVMGENRAVRAQNGHFRDRFTPWQVHVYTTDPNFPEPVQCAEVEAAIDRANAARKKPGNLAFQMYEHTGVKVTASSNRAFNVRADNCLWHLVDGVIEPPDYKHYIDHYVIWSDTTPNQCPDWVELAFDKPVTASRVLLYPAYQSLKDYQLQIWKDGQWQTVADVKDAQGDTHTLTFPAATFSRLRVFITANRGPHSRIREIEVYQK